jgi:hypothetical protein
MDIISIIKSCMEEAEKIEGLTGNNKKQYVIDMVRLICIETWGEKYFNTKIEMLLPSIIEMIISMSKKEFVIDVNRRINKCCLII